MKDFVSGIRHLLTHAMMAFIVIHFFVWNWSTVQYLIRGNVQQKRDTKFYILPMPEITTWLLGNFTEEAYLFYEYEINEKEAEVWLHRALERHTARTDDPSQADVVIIPGYLHFNQMLRHLRGASSVGVPYKTEDWIELLRQRLIPNKTHVVAIPTIFANDVIGLKELKATLEDNNVTWASFGFERNQFWTKKVDPNDIIPVPFVVTTTFSRDQLEKKVDTERTKDFAFYAGDRRSHAVRWSGCNRTKMIQPLQNRTDMDVRIVSEGNRLTQDEYNTRMFTSEYCLILCGDTPGSRSLASSMLHGCIPVRIGSRLRGLCEPPCHPGFGWTVANRLQMPFENQIDWNMFPEVDEALFTEDPGKTLEDLFQSIDSAEKAKLRSTMKRVQMAFTYGWGSPVNSTDFGDAVSYALESLSDYLVEKDQKNDTLLSEDAIS